MVDEEAAACMNKQRNFHPKRYVFVELSLQFFSIPLGYENNHNLDIDLFLISRYLTINFKYYTINFNILLKPASILYDFAVIIVNLLMFN